MKQDLERTEKTLVATQYDLDNTICHQSSRLEYERRLQCQSEQINKLIEQVQWLETNKVRLEIGLEHMEREQEVLRDTQNKIKGDKIIYKRIFFILQIIFAVLEQQLEKEHKNKTLLQKEKLEMEKRLLAADELERLERAKLQGVKRDVKRMKALLKDVQAQLERHRADSSGKSFTRKLPVVAVKVKQQKIKITCTIRSNFFCKTFLISFKVLYFFMYAIFGTFGSFGSRINR